MRTISAIIIAVLFVIVPISVFAQEKGATPPADDTLPGTGQFNDNPYEVGENILAFNLGCFFPIAFYNPQAGTFESTQLYIPGAAFSISYLNTITTGFAIGGEIAGSVSGSIAGRTLFMAPFTFKAAWIFVMMPFEIMPTVSAGAIIETLQDQISVDPVVKVGASYFWRSSIDWSFGLNTNLWVVPQLFYPNPASDRIGFFAEATLTATYHF
jgi:hypothetical protein